MSGGKAPDWKMAKFNGLAVHEDISQLKEQESGKKPRDVLYLLPLQFQRWKMNGMLRCGESENVQQGKLAYDSLRWPGVHASDFNPGSVTFVDGAGNSAWM